MNFYRRKLPHWQPEGAQYFVTIRLANSLPKKAIRELLEFRKRVTSEDKSPESALADGIQRRVFQKYEKHLDSVTTGPTWLAQTAVANIVSESIHYRDSTEYDLFAYCIMSNHVHMVFEHLSKVSGKMPITKIMQEFKRYTARQANKHLGRSGAFWQSESFDRVIRNQDELENTIRYTLNNPVKAGLIDQWEDWPYSYCKPEFIETFKTM